jgi:hypothetical protein
MFFFRLREELWGIYVVVPFFFFGRGAFKTAFSFSFFGRGEE